MTQTTVLHEQRWTHEGRPELNRRADTVPPVAGPWDDEPDKVQWIDGATDLDCLAVRNHFGAWCGYVGVPSGHPCHGQGYEDLDVEVHGGLTFASDCDETAEEGHGICHVPLPGRDPEVWWLGFDCGHGFDLMPFQAAEAAKHPAAGWLGSTGAEYRTLGYVQEQCASLAAQLTAVAGMPDAAPVAAGAPLEGSDGGQDSPPAATEGSQGHTAGAEPEVRD